MDMGSFKALELLLIVGVVGYFYIRQRQNLQRLKEEREAKQDQANTEARSTANADETPPARD